MIKHKNQDKDKKMAFLESEDQQDEQTDDLTADADKRTTTPKGSTLEQPAENDPLNKGDIVRADTSKVALRGLKVVGKIDLLQSNQKDKDSSVEAMPSTDNEPEPSSPGRVKKHVTQKPRKTRVQGQREKELNEEKRKRVRREKVRRTKHYHEKITNYQLPIKPLKKQYEGDHEVYNEKEDYPKSWVSRLFHWFTAC